MLYLFAYALVADDNIIESIGDWYEGMVEYTGFDNITSRYDVVLPTQDLLYVVDIKINPCKSRGTSGCCQDRNAGACEDNPIIEAGPNLEIAWAFNNYVIICSNEFSEELECGTFVEIHRPKNASAIFSLRITRQYSSGYSTEFLYTKNLCAGPYEIWWVVRSRSGRVLHYIKRFFIVYPSCSESQVAEALSEYETSSVAS